MKTITKVTKGIFPFVIALFLLGGCGHDRDSVETRNFILMQNEEANISINAKVLAQTADTKVKITRDIEQDKVTIYVIAGSVEINDM